MRIYTTYGGGYTESSIQIIWFWEILQDFDNEMKSKFLFFVTCSSRLPLMGFKDLNPKFCIHKDPNIQKLPTVSTCFHMMRLPSYPSKEILKNKLLDAMLMSKGFDLH